METIVGTNLEQPYIIFQTAQTALRPCCALYDLVHSRAFGNMNLLRPGGGSAIGT
jgi:hypothetical protein